MATVTERRNRKGEIISYKVTLCLGRDETYKQIWKCTTIKPPEGLTPAKSKKEVQRQADEWAERTKAEYARTHSRTDRAKIPLEEFITEHWMKDFVNDGKHTPQTVAFYQFMADDILSYYGKRTRLAEVDMESVKLFINFFRNEARTRRGEPYSESSVQSIYNTLRGILEYARRCRYILENPCDDLTTTEKPHGKKREIDFLTPAEAQQFMACLELEPLFWRAFFSLLIMVGLRRGEAVALQWRDLQAERLTIQRSATLDKNSPDGIRIGSTKTGDSRTVPIIPELYNLLMELRQEQAGKYGSLLTDSSFIFCNIRDPQRPTYPTTPTTFLRRFCKRHGLRDVSPHDLRHTCASLSLEAGANVKNVQRLLGHADSATTLTYYAEITQEAQKRTVKVSMIW